MKAMYAAFAAIIVIGVGAAYLLNETDVAGGQQASSSVRLD